MEKHTCRGMSCKRRDYCYPQRRLLAFLGTPCGDKKVRKDVLNPIVHLTVSDINVSAQMIMYVNIRHFIKSNEAILSN